MKIKQIMVGIAGSAALVALACAPSLADQVTFSSLVATGPEITYNEDTGFTLTNNVFESGDTVIVGDPGGSVYVASALSVTGGGLQNSGVVATPSDGVDTQELTGGNFAVTSTAAFTLNGVNYAAGTDLLDGTFGSAVLTGTVVSPPVVDTGSIETNFNNVMYDSGIFFNESGLQNPGAFAFDLTSVSTVGATAPDNGFQLDSAGTAFATFTSSGSGTFSASPAAVPEPSSFALFSIGALGIGGLMLRARKSRRVSGTIA